MSRVMGLDLSMTASGVAVPNGQCFTIKPGDPRLGDRRLVVIERGLNYYLDRTKPELALVEKIPTASKGFQVAIVLGMVHGVARKCLAERGIPMVYIDNKLLKQYATGHGAADKRAMIVAANQARFAAEESDMLTDDNQADAWWLRAMGLHHLGHRVVGHLGQIDIDLRDVRDRIVRRDLKWPAGLARKI